jgi:hypothetical protein
LKHGQPFPDWVSPFVTGTALDESNVRKAFNRLLDAADLHRRGPHQMRHIFASPLLREGAPITYVSRQLGHKDASITLRVYAHWIPDPSAVRAVDLLDDTQPSATRAQPMTESAEWRSALSPYGRMVGRVGIVHDPQIKNPIRHAKTFEIRMILQARCAERASPTQIDATQPQPPSKGFTAIRHGRGVTLTGVQFDLSELYIVRNRQFPLAAARSARLYSTGR